MGEFKSRDSGVSSWEKISEVPTSRSTIPTPLPSSPNPTFSLVQPSRKKNKPKTKVFRVFQTVFRSFPIIIPSCPLPRIPGGLLDVRITSEMRVTGTLFGYRKGRVSLCIQENPRCLPSMIIELAIQTYVLQKELAAGMVRIAMECQKRAQQDKTKLFDKPLWTTYCNGKQTGFGVMREATEEDLNILEILKPVTMGAGVLPVNPETDMLEADLAYMRAQFDRIGSKDSETYYMLSHDSNNGPELCIFFVKNYSSGVKDHFNPMLVISLLLHLLCTEKKNCDYVK